MSFSSYVDRESLKVNKVVGFDVFSKFATISSWESVLLDPGVAGILVRVEVTLDSQSR